MPMPEGWPSSYIAREKSDKDKPFPKAEKFNTALSPLGTINGAFNLRWNDNLYEELSRQELEQFKKYGRYGPSRGPPH